MRFRWALLQLVGVQALACGNPHPVLDEVQPNQANSNADVRLSLHGHDLVPATTVDPLSGNRIASTDGFAARVGTDEVWVALTKLNWLSPAVLAASLPGADAKSLPVGLLDVELTDPRGQTARLSGAFRELGLDLDGPDLDILPAPGPFAPGMALRGTITAREAAPGTVASLAWALYENDVRREPSDDDRTVTPCRIPSGLAEVECTFKHSIGSALQAGDVVRVEAEATDGFRNTTRASLSITLSARPKLESIKPDEGGIAGGTDVIVRGQGFVPGSTVTIGGQLLFPNGGIVVADSENSERMLISGYAPAHTEGRAAVVVHTPLGDTNETKPFTYKRPPTIDAITPSSGLAAGGTPVTITGSNLGANTRIYFGATLDQAVPLAEASAQADGTSLIGLAPPGTGTTTVWACDGALGFTQLPGGFTWRSP